MARIAKYVKSHVIIFILVTYLALRKSFKKQSIIKIDRHVTDMKHILLLNNIHGLEGEGQTYFINQKCMYINCYFTKKRHFLGDVRYFDAILFNLQDASEDNNFIIDLRSPSQKYVFVANDSSDNYPVCNPLYDNFFNWTWTYRFDSTISYRFITVYNADYQELGSHFRWNNNLKPIDAILKTQFVTKSKAAVIFLDKCVSRSKRELLITELNADLLKFNLSIDVFGECGSLQCKRKTMKPCFWRIKKNYFFYLAFEDSISYDYITDIVLYAYNNNAVPIVYGAGTYKHYLPPGSYINAHNMSVRDLAIKMNDLISQREKYYEYFRWKNYYSILKSQGLNACALCETLNSPARLNQRYIYKNFRKWWNPLYEERCKENNIILV